MSIDQIIRLIEILAWPTTALLLIWLARKQIRRLAPLIQRIRYNDVEIEFAKRLAEVTEDLGESRLLESGQSEQSDRIYALVDIGVDPVSWTPPRFWGERTRSEPSSEYGDAGL